ncbi:nuclear transport factor 2 family protein [Spirillospora sp. CA-255316]
MDVLDLVRTYFERLEAGDFIGAAGCFSESARYSHPPYAEEPPGSGRHEAHGREAILALFRYRGLRATRHEIIGSAHGDGRLFVSGVVKDADGSVVASFVSEASFDRDLRQLTEYVAYSSRPPVWAAEG